MIIRRKCYIWCLMLALFCAVLPGPYVSDALADRWGADRPEGTPVEGDLSTVDSDGKVVACKDVIDSTGARLEKGALIARIVPCMLYTVEKSTIRFAKDMVSTLRPLLYTFLTLVVGLFGVRVLQNEPQIYKQGFLLVFKVTIVLVVLNDLGGIRSISNVAGSGDLIPAVYKIMNQSQVIIFNALNDTSSYTCDIDKFDNGQPLKIWSTMDCIVGKLFGYTMGTEGKGNMLLGASMFGLLSGFFFGGAWGVVIFLGMVGVLVGLFLLVVRTLVVFINAYLTICLLLILAPLFTPLVFLKVTEQPFEKFWKIILAAFVGPIVVSAYVVLALMLYDKMLFAEKSIVQKLFNWDIVEQAMESTKTVAATYVTGDSSETRLDSTATDVQKNLLMRAPHLQESAMAGLSGSGGFKLSVPALNINNLGPEFEKGKETFERFFYELMQLFILAWLINRGLNQLSSMLAQLTGSRSGSGAIALGNLENKEARAKKGAKESMKAMQKTYLQDVTNRGSAVKGQEFLDRAPAAMNTMQDTMKDKFASMMKRK